MNKQNVWGKWFVLKECDSYTLSMQENVTELYQYAYGDMPNKGTPRVFAIINCENGHSFFNYLI